MAKRIRNKTKANRTGYVGVSRTPGGRFAAYGSRKQRKIYIGSFPTARAAAKARDQWVLDEYGPGARLNFPVGGSVIYKRGATGA